MKRIFGSIAILLVPGALLAQGKGTHVAPRASTPTTVNGTITNTPPATVNGTINTGPPIVGFPPAVTRADPDRTNRNHLDSLPVHKQWKRHHKRRVNGRP